MTKLIYISLLLALAGCNNLVPNEKIVDHKVLVTVPCKIMPPLKPVMPLTDMGNKKDDIFVKSKKALAEINLRKGYEAQLEAANESCK